MAEVMRYLLAGIASFGFIFLKAFQQRNVTLDAPAKAVILTSLAMAATEVYVISAIAREGYSVVLVCCIGVGAGLGCVLAMRVHRRIFRRETRQ